MSGAPVILHSRSSYINNQGNKVETHEFGAIGNFKLLGIYSSREPANSEQLQLGVVFPVVLIEEVIAGIDREG